VGDSVKRSAGHPGCVDIPEDSFPDRVKELVASMDMLCDINLNLKWYLSKYPDNKFLKLIVSLSEMELALKGIISVGPGFKAAKIQISAEEAESMGLDKTLNPDSINIGWKEVKY
jgi:hypothetical protein